MDIANIAKITIEKRSQNGPKPSFILSFFDKIDNFLGSDLGLRGITLARKVEDIGKKLNTQFFVYEKNDARIILLSMKNFSDLNTYSGAPGGHDKYFYPIFDESIAHVILDTQIINSPKNAFAC
jgi:hypothetical protein